MGLQSRTRLSDWSDLRPSPLKAKSWHWFSVRRGPLMSSSYSLPLGGKQEGPHTAGISYAKAKTRRLFLSQHWSVSRLFRRCSDGWVVQDFFPLWLSLLWAHHSRNQPSFLFHCVLVWWWLIPRGMLIPNWQELCIQGQILLAVGEGEYL